MGKYEKELTDDLINYVRERSRRYSDWYVGISKKPEVDMFKKHNVDKKGEWCYNYANDNRTARAVEDKLLMLGFDGAAKISDPKAVGVYVYKKTFGTK